MKANPLINSIEDRLIKATSKRFNDMTQGDVMELYEEVKYIIDNINTYKFDVMEEQG